MVEDKKTNCDDLITQESLNQMTGSYSSRNNNLNNNLNNINHSRNNNISNSISAQGRESRLCEMQCKRSRSERASVAATAGAVLPPSANVVTNDLQNEFQNNVPCSDIDDGKYYTTTNANGHNLESSSAIICTSPRLNFTHNSHNNATANVAPANNYNYNHNNNNATINCNNFYNEDDDLQTRECGILSFRPQSIQGFARIKIFVLLLSLLVTLQQALSSGYINSVITTIEKRFEIPSSLSGLIASSYEIGNVITVIFVSYLGSRRHIPVWIGVGAVIMGIGSLIFMVPHFVSEVNTAIADTSTSHSNICRNTLTPNHLTNMDLSHLSSGLSNPPLAPNTLRENNCLEVKPSTFVPVLAFIIAQLLLGCGGSPLFTLGTTYIDDHIKSDSSSLYIGCMYSMAAFGPVLGFLMGAYLLTFHMDSLSSAMITINPGDRRWVGMWWGGFLLCGVLLCIVAVPFFSFPKILKREKRIQRKLTVESALPNNSLHDSNGKTKAKKIVAVNAAKSDDAKSQCDTSYGKDIKDIPQSMLRLLTNPVYIATCFGACMELVIVSGFVVFLPKYLETQFSLDKSKASIFTGAIAVPGACIGILIGGWILKRFQLKPKGAVQFVLISNVVCLSFYTMLFFLGCDNMKMAGTTIPYFNNNTQASLEPFQVNLTAACNFGCECMTSDVEPVCGNNGMTYFSPCHAGCTAFSSNSDYMNCACVHYDSANNIFKTVSNDGQHAQALRANQDFAEVTVVPVATAGPCATPCRTIYPFLILLFFMTFVVASTQMPLLMIVLRSVSEEERSFALGMQFVIFRLFGYIPAPILFGNLIDSTCLLWKSTCGEKGGRCLIYDIEAFRYKYVGFCAICKILALIIFMIDWWLVRRRKYLNKMKPINAIDSVMGSIISLDKLFEEKFASAEPSPRFEDVNELVLPRNVCNSFQVDFSYDKCTTSLQNTIIPTRQSCRRKHYRSASCDTKMMRSFTNDPYAPTCESSNEFPKLKSHKLFPTHSRNNSSDLSSDFRQKLSNARKNSRDNTDPLFNIRYIQNQLKPSTKEAVIGDEPDSPTTTTGCGKFVKKHSRNFSYDQIYMPNNIRFDPDLFHGNNNNKKNLNLVKNVDTNKVKTSNASNEIEATISRRHSRNNSKDLNLKVVPAGVGSGGSALDATPRGILRHRRSNSKDLTFVNICATETAVPLSNNNNINNNIAASLSASSSAAAAATAGTLNLNVRHSRNHSNSNSNNINTPHHLIPQIDESEGNGHNHELSHNHQESDDDENATQTEMEQKIKNRFNEFFS